MSFRQLSIPILAFLSLEFLGGCASDQERDNVLGEDQFVDIYAALLSKTGQSAIGAADTSISASAREIITEHGVTVDQFERTVSYYNQDLEMWKAFYAKVVAQLEKQRATKGP